MFVNEYGKTIYLNVGTDISAATAYGITFTKPSGATLVVDDTTGVTIGSINIVSGCNETFTADEYLQYTTVVTDIDEAGEWQLRSVIDLGTQHLIGAIDSFVVKA